MKISFASGAIIATQVYDSVSDASTLDYRINIVHAYFIV